MIYISHRGNTTGPNKNLENSPDYIVSALEKYHCEIDVWYKNNLWFLGHDKPQYEISKDFFFKQNLWIHCKNIDALQQLIDYADLNIFWHQEDDYTITSKNFIWCYPNKLVNNTHRAICVMPELHNTDYLLFDGVCSDYIGTYYDKTSVV